MQIDGCDDAHVALAPFAPTVRYLALEELERVKAKFGLWDLERATEHGAGFVLDKEEGTVSFSFGDFLEEAEVGDCREEEAGGIAC